jgi:hypothetical protein
MTPLKEYLRGMVADETRSAKDEDIHGIRSCFDFIITHYNHPSGY